MNKVTVYLFKDENLEFGIYFDYSSSVAGQSKPADMSMAHMGLRLEACTLTSCGGSATSGQGLPSSRYCDALSAYIQAQKPNKGDNGRNLDIILIMVHIDYGVAITLDFDGDFVASLCRILPSPFLQFVARARGTGAKGAQVELPFDKIFELQDILLMDQNYGTISQSFESLIGTNHYCQEGELDFSVIVGWVEPSKSSISIGFVSLIQNLFDNESTKDFTIVAGNRAEVKCHKIIFAAQSRVLTLMVCPTTGMQESELGRVVLKDNSEDGIRLLLRYLYGLELVTDDLPCDLMVELLQTAHKYELGQLQSFIYEELLLRKDVNWFTPDVILQLHFYARNVNEFRTLMDHSLSVMAGMNTNNLRDCEGFKKLGADIQVDLLCELIKLMQKKNEVLMQPGI